MQQQYGEFLSYFLLVLQIKFYFGTCFIFISGKWSISMQSNTYQYNKHVDLQLLCSLDFLLYQTNRFDIGCNSYLVFPKKNCMLFQNYFKCNEVCQTTTQQEWLRYCFHFITIGNVRVIS